MNFASFWAAVCAWWPLNMKAQKAPLLLQATTNPIVIPQSGSVTATVELPGDCNIQVDDWVAFSTDAGFPATMGFRVSIFYGNDWAINYPATNPVRGELIFGTAREPGRIGYRPWKINTYGNRGLLQFNFSNLNTTTITVEICLRGHRNSAEAEVKRDSMNGA